MSKSIIIQKNDEILIKTKKIAGSGSPYPQRPLASRQTLGTWRDFESTLSNHGLLMSQVPQRLQTKLY